MSILRLPVETARRIFELSVRDRYPSFVLPEPENGLSQPIFDCVSPDDIASVCRRWRDIALSDPVLWSTLFISLYRSTDTDKTLRRMIKLLDHCLERSMNIPFSCFIALGNDYFHHSDHQLLFRLSCALFEHQKRWKVIQISLPFDLVEELEAKRACPHFMLRAEDLGMLEAIWVENPWLYSFRGTHHLSSLASLEIELANDSDAMEWVLHSPNLEKLNISAIVEEGNFWNTAGTPITLEKLRYLKLVDCPLSVLQLLNCPALEEFSIQGSDYEFISHFRNFLSRCPPLQTLRVNEVRNTFDLTMREYLIESSPRNLSFTWSFGAAAYHESSALATTFFGALSEIHTETSKAGAFRVLPQLESLELISFHLALASFVELVAARWNVHKGRLKSVKLTRCSFQLSPGSDYSATSDPTILSAVRSAVELFTAEGFMLDVS